MFRALRAHPQERLVYCVRVIRTQYTKCRLHSNPGAAN
jgi:hypothetical protein